MTSPKTKYLVLAALACFGALAYVLQARVFDDALQIRQRVQVAGQNLISTFRHESGNLDLEPTTTFASVGRVPCRDAFPYTHDIDEPAPVADVKKTSVFYCSVPKVASTFTKSLLNNMPMCKAKQVCERKIPTETFKAHRIANETYSFMWVRDPYTRLFAAYENKVFFPGDDWYSLVCRIAYTIKNRNYYVNELQDRSKAGGYDIKNKDRSESVADLCPDEIKFFSEICPSKKDIIDRTEIYSESLKKSVESVRKCEGVQYDPRTSLSKREMYSVYDMHNVTFAEFIRYIITMSSGNLDCINIHLRPIHKLCNPCELRFDFIGRFESFSESLDHVCSKLDEIGIVKGSNRSCDASLTGDKIVKGRVGKAFDVLESLNVVDSELFSSKQPSFTDLRREILLKVWSSFQIRGYVSKAIGMPFTNAELETVTKNTFQDALKDAVEVSTDKEALKAQRRDAMLQAYSTVPMEDMYRLKEYVRKDCLLFGYDDEPEELFNRRDEEKRRLNFDYFAGLLDRK